MGNLVAIVGRPNVGKSTLFNRLIGTRQAIIDDFSGVTRDRLYGSSDWNGIKFNVVDTGGFVSSSEDIYESAIRTQVQIAIEEATVIIFLVDAATGITDLDSDMAEMLRKTKKPVYLAVNKVDNAERHLAANEFWALGFENTLFLSSATGSGTGELLDQIVQHITSEIKEEEEKIPKFAVIGQPNAGKSSLINSLLGEERNIVTPLAGTTRDSINSRYQKYGLDFLLIDTAGVRKKNKVHEDLEFYSVMRAINAIEESDVVLLVIDAVMGIEAQDMALFRLAQKRNKGIVLLINKWDLIPKETNTARDYEAVIKEKIAPFTDVPVLFISAMEKQRILQAVEKAMEVYKTREKKIKTSVLNDILLEEIERNPPPTHRGRYIKIKYITQLPTYYPAFAFFCNNPQHVKDNYKHFLENKVREHFGFTGTPIGIFFRQK
jgi:GTP-binding protein